MALKFVFIQSFSLFCAIKPFGQDYMSEGFSDYKHKDPKPKTIMNANLQGHAILISVPLLSLLLSGCIVSETVEPSEPQIEDNTIILNVSTPEAAIEKTRAIDPGLQLRYVAKLFKGDADGGEFVDRKEILADGTIIFNAPIGEYTVDIFADYIDAGATPNSNGQYPDRFYDTSTKNEFITMQSFRSRDGKKTFKYNCINNDNYQCYATRLKIKKEETAYENSLTLKRAVAKVRVVSKDGDINGIDKIRLTAFSFMDEYNFKQKLSGTHVDIESKNILEFEPSAKSSRELFFFYTFGSLQSSGSGPGTISFGIVPLENYEYKSVTIPGGTYYPDANHVYTLKGSFLNPTTQPPQPSNEIRLTVTTTDGWDGSEEKEAKN